MKKTALTAALIAVVLNGWLYVAQDKTAVGRNIPAFGEAAAGNFAFRKPLAAQAPSLDAPAEAVSLPAAGEPPAPMPDVMPIFDEADEGRSQDAEPLSDLACLSIAPVPQKEISLFRPLLERQGWLDRVIIQPFASVRYQVHAGPFDNGRTLKRVQQSLAEAGIPASLEPTAKGSRLYLGYFTDRAAAKNWAQAQAALLQIGRMSVTSMTPNADDCELVFTNLTADENKLVRDAFAPALPGARVRPCR